jgi:xanthine dehydrogenase accessory factor
MNDPRLWELAGESIRHGRACSLLVVVETEGSGPGRPGAAMVVTGGGGTIGTVGGGTMEMVLMGRALEMMGNSVPGPELVKHLHAEHGDPGDGSPSGMICSGSQLTAVLPLGAGSAPDTALALEILRRGGLGTILLSPAGLTVEEGPSASGGFSRSSDDGWIFSWPLGLEDTVYIIGGGHVGQALAELLSRLPFRPVVLDGRVPPSVDLQYEWRVTGYREAASRIPPGNHSWVVVMTPDHGTDGDVLRSLSGMEFRYVGLMGSLMKKESLFGALRGAGVREEWLAGVRCPIGLPVGGKSPWEVAVSVAAQLLGEKYRNEAGPQFMQNA